MYKLYKKTTDAEDSVTFETVIELWIRIYIYQSFYRLDSSSSH